MEQERNPAPSDVSATASWSWLLLIMGIALVLRCAFISRQSLWVDEAQSWWFASDLGRALASERTNPPLYYTTLHFWIGWFGHSEAALRSLSVVPGVISVGLVYAFAKKLFTRGIALGASLYQCISSFQIYYSQEVRTFAFLELFLLMAGLALWNALEVGPLEGLPCSAAAIPVFLRLHAGRSPLAVCALHRYLFPRGIRRLRAASQTQAACSICWPAVR